jgi:hypothetical protein
MSIEQQESFEYLIKKKLREHLNNKADDLALGGAQDYADYRHRVGVIEGIAIAEREVIDLIDAAKKRQEEL